MLADLMDLTPRSNHLDFPERGLDFHIPIRMSIDFASSIHTVAIHFDTFSL